MLLQAIGSLISAWSGGWLIDTTGPRFTILIMALFPLLISCTALLIPHGPSSKDHTDSVDASGECKGLLSYISRHLQQSLVLGIYIFLLVHTAQTPFLQVVSAQPC